MVDWSWISTTGSAALMVALSTVGVVATLILLTRLTGLRSFSKMSSFDFAITVATGSVLASTLLTPDPPLLQGVVALAAMFLIQFSISFARKRSQTFQKLVDNEPLLLMAGDEMIEENLKRARVSPFEVREKLREANVIHPSQIRAVVMETTGDLSVLHASPDGPDLDLSLLDGVRGVERLHGRPHVQR